MSQKQNLYVGHAGQVAVMAEFLLRGWNVALPEVDVGEDMLVVKDETGELWRIQVKTATAKPLQTGYFAQFNVSLSQLWRA
ncbi:MAG TPA: group I intron-associated PD-(D/E)XK endonuclease [Thermoanaerobaculia bacterium]